MKTVRTKSQHTTFVNSTLLPPVNVLFGKTATMQNLRAKLEKAASANIPILIEGETGTGKDLIAKFVHRCSPWGSGPFVKVSCPSIPPALLESELFGFEEGAFTGASRAKPGRVEAANSGSLFLDEIAEMESGLQAKLLHMLQDSEFSRIGAQDHVRVKTRILCATNRSLLQEIAAGRFRQDLFYRINGVNVHLPPLRERKQDLPDLCNYFLRQCAQKLDRDVPPFSMDCLQLLHAYTWPGNIRELENLMIEYVTIGEEQVIVDEMFARMPSRFGDAGKGEPPPSLRLVAKKASALAQRDVILRVLAENRWNRRATAKALRISYRALLYKIKESGIPSKQSLESRWSTAGTLQNSRGAI